MNGRWSVRVRLARVLGALLLVAAGALGSRAQMASTPVPPVLGTGVLPADQVERLLPGRVYYKGQSAPLQLRNAAAIRDAAGTIAWVSLVDTSGYSTGLREQYQFYLVTEAELQFGTATVPAGAYGGGFLSDGSAVLLDLGAHEIRRTPAMTDDAMRRPRPLQVVPEGAGYRLYLGKQYVSMAFKPQ